MGNKGARVSSSTKACDGEGFEVDEDDGWRAFFVLVPSSFFGCSHGWRVDLIGAQWSGFSIVQWVFVAEGWVSSNSSSPHSRGVCLLWVEIRDERSHVGAWGIFGLYAGWTSIRVWGLHSAFFRRHG